MHRLAHLVLSAALLGTAAAESRLASFPARACRARSPARVLPGGAAPTRGPFTAISGRGRASWRIVLAELLVLAHMAGAAFIEPCVHKSRLVACDVAQSKGYNRVLVSELFDVPALSTFATIAAAMRPMGKPIAPCACDFHASPRAARSKGLPDSYGISVKELACESAERSLWSTRTGARPFPAWTKTSRARFWAPWTCASAYDDAKGLAGLMGLPERFVAYHWRPRGQLQGVRAAPDREQGQALAQLPSSSHADTNATLLISDRGTTPTYTGGGNGHIKNRARSPLRDCSTLDSSSSTARTVRCSGSMPREWPRTAQVILDAGRIRALKVLNRTTEADLARVFSERMLALTFATQPAGDLGEVSVWISSSARRRTSSPPAAAPIRGLNQPPGRATLRERSPRCAPPRTAQRTRAGPEIR